MARAIVCVGVPANLEVRDFEYKKGDKAGEQGHELSFVLDDPATAVSGSLQLSTNKEEMADRIREAAAERSRVEIVCKPNVIAYTGEDKDGKPEARTFVKMQALAIVG